MTVVRFTLPQRSPVPIAFPGPARAGQNRCARVGDAKTAIGVAVKTEVRAGKIPVEASDDLRNFFGAGAAVGIADNDAAYFLADALFDELVKVVEAALFEIAIAREAVFAAAATCVHGVLEIDEDFKAVLLQIVDGLPRHQQIFFGRGFERAHHVEQPRLNNDHRGGNAALVADDKIDVGPVFNFRPAAARAAEKRELHRAGIDDSIAAVRSQTNWLAPANPISA